MTEPSSEKQISAGSHLLHPHAGQSVTQNTAPESFASSPVHLSQASSFKSSSRQTSPLPPSSAPPKPTAQPFARYQEEDTEETELDEWDIHFDDPATEMPSDLRPDYIRPDNGQSMTRTPLLTKDDANGYNTSPTLRPQGASRNKSATFKSRDPDEAAQASTRKRYTYAAFFLVLSLISFTIQTETAVYIKNHLEWNKSYAMLYFTHGSWSSLWFVQLLILRLQKYSTPWPAFWRRHLQILTQTAQMVQHQDIHAPQRYVASPWPSYFRTLAFITCALTVAGGSWYVAVSMTTASDLTAIYNCSAFFAYAFSIPLLNEKLRWSKVVAVVIAIIGVLVVAYGDAGKRKHGSHSGGGAGGAPDDDDTKDDELDNRALGNLIIGVGSVLYGLYEVLYKRMLCPPEETSPGRSMIFANFVGSGLGLFTLLVMWIPLPILHYTGLELWEWPPPGARGMLLLSVTCNAIFSGSFLVLISLTSPVLSSVAALLTIFLVALVDELLPEPLHNDLSQAAWIGGLLIIVAFVVLSWATYKEMDEERRKKAEEVDVGESDVEEGDA